MKLHEREATAKINAVDAMRHNYANISRDIRVAEKPNINFIRYKCVTRSGLCDINCIRRDMITSLPKLLNYLCETSMLNWI